MVECMKHQKKILVIHDLACYGRCAMTVIVPILSAYGAEVVPVPTTLLSSNGAFPNYYKQELTEAMKDIFRHFEELELTFDMVIIGYLVNYEQAMLIKEVLPKLMKPDTLVILDPIMGDNKRLYSVTSNEVIKGYQELVRVADMITPNVTECLALINEDLSSEVSTSKLIERLKTAGAKNIIITSVTEKDQLTNVVSLLDNEFVSLPVNRIADQRSGTGDVFLGVLAGELANGEEAISAVRYAADFISETLTDTLTYELPSNRGVVFEKSLKKLTKRIP